MNNRVMFFVEKVFYLILFVLLWQETVYCQKSNQAILLATLQDTRTELDISEYLYGVAEKASGKFYEHKGKGLIAIRVCSPEPLQIALFYGMGKPLYHTKRFRDLLDNFRNNQPPDPATEIYFLRTDKACKVAELFTIQYWFVPKDADFPEFIEYRKINDININGLIYETLNFDNIELRLPFKANKMLLDDKSDVDVDSKIFETSKQKVADLLKRNKTSYLLIGTPVNPRQQRIINPRAVALKTFLNQQGIGNYRIFVRKCSWCFNNTYHSTSKDLYPEASIFYQEPPQKSN